MTVWFTSDLHLFHDRTFIYSARGYGNVDIYSENIIANINEKVLEDDVLYILGDLVLNDDTNGIKLLKKIKCKNVYVVLGNHDNNKRRNLYNELPNFKVIGYAGIYRYSQKKSFYLSHYPVIMDDDKRYCLCGHSHTTDKFMHMKDGSYHVDLDCHENYPVSIEEIINDIREWREENLNEF